MGGPRPRCHRASDVQNAVSGAGVPGPPSQILGTGSTATVQVQADLTKLSAAQQTTSQDRRVTNALAGSAHTSPTEVSLTDVGPTWGSQITEKAIMAVLVFFIVVVSTSRSASSGRWPWPRSSP